MISLLCVPYHWLKCVTHYGINKTALDRRMNSWWLWHTVTVWQQWHISRSRNKEWIYSRSRIVIICNCSALAIDFHVKIPEDGIDSNKKWISAESTARLNERIWYGTLSLEGDLYEHAFEKNTKVTDSQDWTNNDRSTISGSVVLDVLFQTSGRLLLYNTLFYFVEPNGIFIWRFPQTHRFFKRHLVFESVSSLAK